MDAGTLSSVLTVVFFVLFIAIVWWAYSRNNKEKFEDAARLPFQEEAGDAGQRH
jgi:cytochrome c oxidase cbb3-type subunit 4